MGILLGLLLPAAGTPALPAEPAEEGAATERHDEDPDVAERLRAILDAIGGFEEVDVSVTHGVVRLEGRVVDGERRARAAELVSRLEGVVYVLNDLETNTQVEARVSPAVERLQGYLDDSVAYLPILGVALVVLLVFWLLSSLAGRLHALFERFGAPSMIGILLARLLRFVVMLIGLVLALDVLGITALVGAVLGTAGVVGIAIGFAFQDIIENYLAGLLLSVRRPFALDDHVVVSGEEGKVVRLTARELILMTLDGNHVRIPNAAVFKSTILNYTRNPRRRFEFSVGVGVEEDLVGVQRLGAEALLETPGVMEQPGPFARVTSLGDSNVVVNFFGWVDQTKFDFGKVRSEAIRVVKAALDDAGVAMPEPIYVVKTVPSDAKPADGAAREPTSSVAAAVEDVREADVAVDSDLDDQIREDRATSDEPNLLESE